MRFRVEVEGGADDPAYLLVEAPDGTPWEALDAPVRREIGLSDEARLLGPGRVLLDPATIIGTPPLLDGLLLTVDLTVDATPARQRSRGGSDPNPTYRRAAVGSRGETRPPSALLEVTGGPDAGGTFAVPVGDHVLGRSRHAELHVCDPGLSRRHVRIAVRPDSVRVQDLGSANGTRVEGAEVTSTWTDVPAGAELEAGGSTFRLRIDAREAGRVTQAAGPAGPSAEAVPGPDGLIRLRVATTSGGLRGPIGSDSPFTPTPPGPRRPTPPGATPPTEIRYPAAPPTTRPNRAALATAAVPLLMAGVLAALMRNWTYLLVGLLGPVTFLSQLVTERRRTRSGAAAGNDRYAAAKAAADRAVLEALERERDTRLTAHPPLPEVLARARTRGGLWRAADDEWSVRLGCGIVATQVVVTRDDLTRTLELPEAPLAVPLSGHRVALCGTAAEVASLARSMLVQLATRHPPDQCRIRCSAQARAVLGAGWPEWLPHVAAAAGPPDADRELWLLTSPAGPVGPAFPGEVNATMAARAAQPRPALSRAALVLVPDADTAVVPAWCDIVVRVRHGEVCVDARTTPGQTAPPQRVTGRAELLSLRRAAAAARALAPLRSADVADGPATELPGLLAALNLPDDVQGLTECLRRRWTDTPGREPAGIRLGALLGDVQATAGGSPIDALTGDGPCELDLDRDGPHVLLAGMTGSGKSELLQTIVTSLVVRYPPEDLALVLMDYKGGSTFAPFAALPHTVGLLTDLDPDATARALRGLGAELRHRETLLRAAGVADARGYRAYRQEYPDAAPMPRLVVLVDEYRVLAEDHAPLMTALVRIAGLGRGLGLHLVLATQRPGGIVSAEIRANVNARIALRVRDAGESHDVIDAADAARLDPHRPGRGFLRIGSRPPVAFQAVRAGEPVRGNVASPLRVTRRRSPGPPPDRPGAPHRGDGGDTPWGDAADRGAGPHAKRLTVVEVVAAAATAAAGYDGHHRPPPVWAPPLPPRVSMAGAAAPPGEPATDAPGHDPDEPSPPPAWPYALADDPDGRHVQTLHWRPVQDGHLALVGTAATGRTAAVRSLLAALGTTCPGDLRLFVIDATGGLSEAAAMPQCVAVAGLDDLAGVRRLLDRVTAGQPPATALALLVIHGWEQACAALDAVDHGRGSARLTDLLRAGRDTPVRALITGDRALLAGAVAGLVEHKVVLRMADARDALIAGVRQQGYAGSGRGVQLPSGRVVQLADASRDQLADAAATARAQHRRCPRPARLVQLPRRILLSDIPPGQPGRLVIGVDCSGGPAWVNPAGSLLVVGPPGSGRSSALRAIAQRGLEQGHRVQLVTEDDDPVYAGLADRWPAGLRVTRPSRYGEPPSPGMDPDSAGDEDGSRPDALVLVDDVESLPPPALQRLDQLTGSNVALIVATRTSHALASYTGLIGRLRRGDALILWPAPADGQLVGVTLQAGNPPIPGRGALVRRGRVHDVQIATAEPMGGR